MPSRPVNIPTYAKNLSGIVAGQKVRAAHQVNNYTNIEATTTSLEGIAEDHDERFKGIERQSFVKYFDDAKVTSGANTLTIDAGATIVNLVDAAGGYTEVKGWANSGSISVAGIASGVMWAISNTLTYQATDSNPASRPANGFRVFIFTNSGGVVTVNPKTFQNAIDSDNHFWEGSNSFRGPIQIPSSNPVYSLPPNYHDVRIEYKNASTVTIKAGSRVRSSDNTDDIVFAADTDVNLAVSGAGGLDTGAEAANAWYYLYAIRNPLTGISSAVLSVVNESASGSIALPSGFTKKRQLQLAVRNSASANIEGFDYYSALGLVLWTNTSFGAAGTSNLVNSGAPSTSWTNINASSIVPPISRLGVFQCGTFQAGATNSNLQFRKSLAEGTITNSVDSRAGQLKESVWSQPLQPGQIFQYSYQGGTDPAQGRAGVSCLGFHVTEVI